MPVGGPLRSRAAAVLLGAEDELGGDLTAGGVLVAVRGGGGGGGRERFSGGGRAVAAEHGEQPVAELREGDAVGAALEERADEGGAAVLELQSVAQIEHGRFV